MKPAKNKKTAAQKCGRKTCCKHCGLCKESKEKEKKAHGG